jgi:hypothetical protein
LDDDNKFYQFGILEDDQKIKHLNLNLSGGLEGIQLGLQAATGFATSKCQFGLITKHSMP